MSERALSFYRTTLERISSAVREKVSIRTGVNRNDSTEKFVIPNWNERTIKLPRVYIAK